MQLRNKQDIWSGVMFVALGVGFALGATNYSMGTAARMGTGYFPFWLGVLLALLGDTVALGALTAKNAAVELDKSDWKISLIVIGLVVDCDIFSDFLGVYILSLLLF